MITGNPNDITDELLINSEKYLEIIKMDIQRFYNPSLLNSLNSLTNYIKNKKL